MRALLLLLGLAACQQYESLKAKYITSEPDWQHMPASGPPVDHMADPCSTSLHDDDYYGFSVGRPQGWRVDYSTGTIVVSRDESDLVAALVYPARMRHGDLPPEQLLQNFSNTLARSVRNAGGAYQLADKVTDGHVATALATATLGGVKLRGQMQVMTAPGFATLKFYWAPETELTADEPTLRQIVSCFARKTVITRREPVAPPGGPQTRYGVTAPSAAQAKPEHALAMELYRGRFMVVQRPAGWQVTAETDHGIDMIMQNRNAAFDFTYVIQPHGTADVYARREMQKYQGAQIISAGLQPAPAGWQVATVEFTANAGYPTHGYVRVAVGNGVATETTWLIAAEKWDALEPTLVAMAGSVQIQPAALAQVRAEVRQQLASYPPIKPTSQPDRTGIWSGWSKMEDRQSQGYEDTTLQQDHAKSPSSGETYTVPWNAWSATGPDGAGYYRQVPGGGVERLDVDGQ
ncbi:MAG TPA: hypothetical protein VH143_14600 [Kofleriaceae bacterium]|jgi:hypothetical protein|nr:hypothetical protein [Kofleriaceae bacterium]